MFLWLLMWLKPPKILNNTCIHFGHDLRGDLGFSGLKDMCMLPFLLHTVGYLSKTRKRPCGALHQHFGGGGMTGKEASGGIWLLSPPAPLPLVQGVQGRLQKHFVCILPCMFPGNTRGSIFTVTSCPGSILSWLKLPRQWWERGLPRLSRLGLCFYLLLVFIC